MRFTALPVHSFEDATLDLEQLQALFTTPGAQLPFVQLASAKQIQLAVGSGNVTFTASTDSAGTVVTHGLGRVPAFLAAFNTTGAQIWFSGSSVTSTQMTIFGAFRTAISGTFSFVWIAVG